MKRILLVLGVLVALALPVVAVASGTYDNHGWYWSNKTADTTYYDKNADTPDLNVACHGYGDWIRGQRVSRLYAHFRCVVDDGYDDWFSFRMHVTGKRRYAVSNVSCVHYYDPADGYDDPDAC